jgi:hypothetical protein
VVNNASAHCDKFVGDRSFVLGSLINWNFDQFRDGATADELEAANRAVERHGCRLLLTVVGVSVVGGIGQDHAAATAAATAEFARGDGDDLK